MTSNTTTVSLHIEDVVNLSTSPIWTEEQLESIERQLQSALASVRQARNEQCAVLGFDRRVSIRTTPDEILSLIFECLLSDPSEDVPPDVFYIHSLLTVCRRWRRVALATPGLWRDLVTDRTPRVVARETIDRRKTLPFFVWASSLHSIYSLSSLRPWFSRQIQRLVLDEPIIDSADDLSFIHPCNLPSMEFLSISNSRIDVDGEPPLIFLSDFQNLRIIKSKGFLTSWTRRPFPLSATDISFDISGMGGAPTVTQLFESLEYLKDLESVSIVADAILAAWTVDRLTLPSIRNVEFTVPHEDHKDILRILPIQSVRPYSLKLHLPPFCRRSHISIPPPDFYDNLRMVIQRRTLPYTSIRILIDDGDLTLILIDAEHHVLSFTTRTRCGPEPKHVLELLQPLHITNVYLEQARKPQTLLPCRRMIQEVIPLLVNTSELTIRHKLAHDAGLILIGLAGTPGKLMFPGLSPYEFEWPNLHTIILEDIRYNGFDDDADQASRRLGLCLWAIKTRIPTFNRVEVVRCGVSPRELSRWAELIQEVLCIHGSDMDGKRIDAHTVIILSET